jgi:selenocysteine-specific elongation factor
LEHKNYKNAYFKSQNRYNEKYKTNPTHILALAWLSQVVRKALAGTRFANAPVIPVAAHVGGSGKSGAGGAAASLSTLPKPPSTVADKAVNGMRQINLQQDCNGAIGLQELVAHLQGTTSVPHRNPDGPLLFSVDHCFNIKGQGTVLTGTVLGGRVTVGQVVELPELKLERKVKSIQMFRRPVTCAEQGERICTQYIH